MRKKSAVDPIDEEVIEIRGKEVFLKRGESIVMRLPLAKVVQHLAQAQPRSAFPDGSPIPDQVRYIHTRGDATLVVVELSPQVRRVRWVSETSLFRHGDETRYESVNLAFPFIVIPILFKEGALSGCQQLFYRTRPLSSEEDPLFLPNLLNVATAYDFLSWFCLKKMEDVSRLPLGCQIEKVIEHLWGAGFNESADSHGSYWNRMRAAKLDPRISSLESWARATEEDPLFMVKIPWQNAGVTLREVIEWMFLKGSAPGSIETVSDLITRICALLSRRSPGRLKLTSLQGFQTEEEEQGGAD